MTIGPSDLERLLSPAYVDGLEALPLAEVRSRRAECQELEVALSYMRRLAQGRLDIVHAELERRSGAQSGDLSDLVDQLPGILSGRVRAPGSGRLPTLLAPDLQSDDSLTEELDAVAGVDRLSKLADLDEADARSMAGELETIEARLSAQRRSLHERIDLLQAEIVGRYKRGEASVDNLLR